MSFVVYAELSPRHRAFAPGVHVCTGVAAARTASHTVIQHPRGKRYEAVVVDQHLRAASMVGAVSVRNHTDEELALIRRVLDRLPRPIVTRFAEQYNGIVCVDWTGSNWRDETHPNGTTLLSGGANMEAARTRGGINETGRRIELTHSTMYELRGEPFGRRGLLTLWHELGHVAYRGRFTPRRVERGDYGESIHVGVEEQPAYAFMWYFLAPSRLTRNDRAAFDRVLEERGALPPAPPRPGLLPSVDSLQPPPPLAT